MPYISQEERRLLDYGALPNSAGQLNYSITILIKNYLARNKGRVSYADYNEVLGVLEGVKLEIYRRVIAKYEDKKRESNGDVY